MNTFLTKTFVKAKCFFGNKSGATAIEYGLIAAAIAVAIGAAFALLGPALLTMFQGITADLAV